MEWRRVQVERPSSSTSGGQSEGIELGVAVADAARGVVAVVIWLKVFEEEVDGVLLELEAVADSALACFVRARHEATEVQVRQLE